jgi:hypothetical protein
MMMKHPLYTTLSGFSRIAIGLCLSRYAYMPLIPSLIDTESPRPAPDTWGASTAWVT